MIDLENLTKTFPGAQAPAVDRLNLHVDRGEIVVFVGPSGCGKTTTLKMINRLVAEAHDDRIHLAQQACRHRR